MTERKTEQLQQFVKAVESILRSAVCDEKHDIVIISAKQFNALQSAYEECDMPDGVEKNENV